jgi:uncharacterized protein YgiB involved in biofilm formation
MNPSGDNIIPIVASGVTMKQSLSGLSAFLKQLIYVTGGTYTAGTAVFRNNTGGTFNVTGFSTGTTDTFVTGGTYSWNSCV